ncbi:hypothetical protein EKO23_11575 [Nocardioides guangzhouensis]|uniref:Uncharacterized protein n=1 Tax=Nocardioides guangzhouensis TaxID=2497878 RepID=A0A4Q4ZE32_9ACTN|nr:hypothetical protein [Nocardioides guangzhouensis]RYP85641.1 hypothetical protein EKO23_11575 [Nocardioides guangzhouensis]
MSAPVSPRLAYDDPSSPREMFGDCRAVGANLALVHPLDAARGRPAPRTEGPAIEVSVEAATMAGSLHLHLD